jgi:putative membrane protein
MSYVFLYSSAVVYFIKFLPHLPRIEANDITAASSIVIGLIVAFRINSAYDRWWEGRKLWGQLVNEIRNLSIKYDLYFDASDNDKKSFGKLLIAFAFSFKDHLRGRTNWAGLTPSEPCPKNVPLQIAKLIFADVEKHRQTTSHDRLELLLFDSHMKALMDICGSCERIANSPIAGWFQASIWVWVIAYLSSLPWLMVDELHAMTIVVTLFAAYFSITLELIAEEIQEPFGCEINDLPTDKICLTIADSVEQILM